jgi:hypothetical protein
MEENNDLLDPEMNAGGNSLNAGSLPNATATLVLGICSIVGCLLYGLPGLICGVIALVLHKKDKEIYHSNPAKYEMSYKNAKAGYICAIIGTSLSALYFIVALVMITTMVSFFESFLHR